MYRFLAFLLVAVLLTALMTFPGCKEDEPLRSILATPILRIEGPKVSCDRCPDFGTLIENNGDQVFIGGYSSVSILDYNGGNLSLTQQLEDLGGSGLWDIWVDSEWLFVGAADEDGTGILRVYSKSGATWALNQTISIDRFQDNFGSAIDMDQDVLVVGASAIWADDLSGGNADEGRIYVYELSAGNWIQTQEVASNLSHPNDHFGEELAIHNDLIIAGSTWSPLHIYRYDGSLELLRLETLITATGIEHSGDRFFIKAVNPESVFSFRLLTDGTFEDLPINFDFGDIFVTDFGEAFSVDGDMALVGMWIDNLAYTLGLENNQWELVSTVTGPEDDVLFEFKGLDLIDDQLVVGGELWQVETSVVYFVDR